MAGEWSYVQCAECGLLYLAPMPDDAQLREIYSDYSDTPEVTVAGGRGARYPRLRKLFHRLSGDVDPRDFVLVPKGARVLDYGCGQGTYLLDFHRRGVNISGAEIEGALVDAGVAEGLDVHRVDDLARIPFADEEFDIVYLMQVFEHLRDPDRFMRELNRVLKPGGALFIAVPNERSLWRKVFGKNAVSGWFAPFHLFHWDADTLASVARRTGLEPVQNWSRTPDSWFRLNLKAFCYPSENVLDRRKTWLDGRLARIPLMLLLRILEIPIRQSDCLVMKMEKRALPPSPGAGP